MAVAVVRASDAAGRGRGCGEGYRSQGRGPVLFRRSSYAEVTACTNRTDQQAYARRDFNQTAFPITTTSEKAMNSAAHIGLRKPSAARGIATML